MVGGASGGASGGAVCAGVTAPQWKQKRADLRRGFRSCKADEVLAHSKTMIGLLSYVDQSLGLLPYLYHLPYTTVLSDSTDPYL